MNEPHNSNKGNSCHLHEALRQYKHKSSHSLYKLVKHKVMLFQMLMGEYRSFTMNITLKNDKIQIAE